MRRRQRAQRSIEAREVHIKIEASRYRGQDYTVDAREVEGLGRDSG